ncbi:YebY family protein [Nocardioides panacisoli]|uniref:YebY family protein n=1 Tax=Nocardioides panacisoli TaxID=627624 RepID=UPI001C626170|nr:YebY family protein [Nocardioides panacisoli]QYJ03866.1 YebY family protein [Nocardioides panacisoli]
MRRLPILGLTLVLPGCSPDKEFATRDVDREDYCKAWPLTVDDAVLACEPGDVTTVTVDGNSYRLDELPTVHDASSGLLRIWAVRPSGGPRMDLSPLAQGAKALCD